MTDADPPTEPGKRAQPSGGRKLAGLRVAVVGVCACLALGGAGTLIVPEVALDPWLETVVWAVTVVAGIALGFFGGNTGEWLAQAWAKRGRG